MNTNINIKLENTDLQELSFKCFSYGITIPELISEFINDLLGNKHTGVYVSNWFRL